MTEQNIIYILTNPSFPDWIKIGRCSNLEARVKSLSTNTAVPLPFDVFYACLVVDGPSVEAKLFEIFEKDRITSNREFFSTDPEQVAKVLSLIKKSDVEINLKVDPADQDAIAKAIEKDGFFSFVEADVPLGAEIHLTRLPQTKAIVVDQHTVKFENKKWDFTELTRHLLKTKFGKNRLEISAPRYWSYRGEMLVVLKSKRLTTP